MNIDTVLIAAAIVMLAATAASLVARRLNLGSTVALIAVGLLLGPHSPLPVLTDVAGVQAVGDVGVALLLFSVGMDIRPANVWSMRRLVFRFGGLQFVLVAAAIGAVLVEWDAAPWLTAVIVALGLSMSSDAVAFGTLEERGAAATTEGRATTAVQIFQILASIPILAAVPMLGLAQRAASARAAWIHVGALVATIGALYLALRYALPHLMAATARRLGTGAFKIVILAAVVGASAVLDLLGVSMALGALLAGTVLSRSLFADQIKASVAPVKQLLLALFFMAMGMSIDFGQVRRLGTALLVALPLLFVVKFALTIGIARVMGLAKRAAAATALLLIPCDEIAYVIFRSAHEKGLMPAPIYALGLAMISLSFVLSPLIISIGYRLIDRWASPPVEPGAHAGLARGRVVVIGYGYIGRAVCGLLERSRIVYVAFDVDLDRVASARTWGHNVHYGDGADTALMTTAAFDRARLIVVATSRFESAKSILATFRQFYAAVPVMTAVQYLAERDELVNSGASDVTALMPEGVLQFGGHVLKALKVEPTVVAEIVSAFERDDYGLLRHIAVAPTAPIHPSMDGERTAALPAEEATSDSRASGA